MNYLLGVDVGGTYTDFVLINNETGAQAQTFKTPSTPRAPMQSVLAGLDRLAGQGVKASSLKRLVHGTTVATNALIQRTGGPAALLITRGFRDLLAIGRQRRPKLYDLLADKPAPFVARHHCLEITERVRADGAVATPLAAAEVHQAAVWLRQQRIPAVGLCFLHSYANPQHEQQAAAILRAELGDDVFVCASWELLPEFREYERLSTTVMNAYVGTVMDHYLARLTADLKQAGVPGEPLLSLSSGGLSTVGVARRLPLATALSGPGAGVMAATRLAASHQVENVITLDMGGTSTDVALIRHGQPVETAQRELAGFPVRFPALDIQTIGAGGGSIAWLDSGGLLKVGPESAGAQPGPACWGQGGHKPTVTDAQLLVGGLVPDLTALGYKEGAGPRMSRALAAQAIQRHIARPLGLSVAAAAQGILAVAVANMVRAIWGITAAQGVDPRDFTLLAYGGAGPMLAAAVAAELGVKRAIIPRQPGTFSALGLLQADVRFDLVQTIMAPWSEKSLATMQKALHRLQVQGAQALAAQGVPAHGQRLLVRADLRYQGQDFELPVDLFPEAGGADGQQLSDAVVTQAAAAFHAQHERAYGWSLPRRALQLVSLRLQAQGKLARPPRSALVAWTSGGANAAAVTVTPPPPAARQPMRFQQGTVARAPVFRREDLSPGMVLSGPALIVQAGATTLLPPGAVLTVVDDGGLHVHTGQHGQGAGADT